LQFRCGQGAYFPYAFRVVGGIAIPHHEPIHDKFTKRIFMDRRDFLKLSGAGFSALALPAFARAVAPEVGRGF